MNFTDIKGHELTIRALQNAVREDRIFHCYLFTGEESIGKRLVALAFAKTLLCKSEGIEPCNRCNSCLKFDSWNHPDLVFIEPENRLIKKEVIDKLIKSMSILPLESKRKIVIIDQCDKMEVETQNALLKTLEEPPSYVNIILITSNANNLIPTILSRSQLVKFHPVESKHIIELIVSKYGKTREEADFIAHFTKGSVGKSITLCQHPEFFERRDNTISLVHDIIRGDRINVLNSIDFFVQNKDYMDEIIDIMIYWFRDLMLYKEIGNSILILNKDKIQLLSSETFLDMDRINDIIDNIMKTKKLIDNNVNFQLAIETMLLNMQEV